jgi:hypothetical protein
MDEHDAAGPAGRHPVCCDGWWFEYFTSDDSGEHTLMRVEQHKLWCSHAQAVVTRGA